MLNPTSLAKLDELAALFDLPANASVLDIACGKGEVLLRVLGRYRCAGVGIDLSPYFIRDARERALARLPRAKIELREGDGAAYDGAPESFDLVMCLGASWIWQGHRGTLKALARWTKPGGLVLAGEPFWLREPDREYLAVIECTRETFGTHEANVRCGVELGLTPLHAMVSNGDDWDRYEGLQWRAAETWVDANPNDPDRDEVLAQCRRYRDAYLRSGRDTLGWALYLFRK